MENFDPSQGEMKAGFLRPVNSDVLLNMAGVILFYVVVFVAFSVFAGQI